MTEKDKYIFEYIAFILNNYLNQEFRYKKGLAYKLSVENFSSVNYGIFSIYVSSDSEYIYKQILEKTKELHEKINEINMEVIKNNMVSNFIFDIEKLSKTASFYSENYLFNNEITIEEEIRNIKKVTLKDIKESLTKLLQQSPKVVILK
ncbi:MAG: insulinase family protein [Magnetococcus sp. XQGC-1]